MIRRPPAVDQIFDIFSNYPIYLVGGCVRDQLLGRAIKDWDFTTSCTPDQATAILNKHNILVVPTGISHGTISAVIQGCNYEITTFRQDVETDGRRAVTKFTDNVELDSYRRDLTINALYMDRHNGILDFHQGQRDLNQKILRFVGDAGQRITEDYLRILRFFRFQNSLGFDLDINHRDACLAHSQRIIQHVSIERIWAELAKIFAYPVSSIQKLKDFPEVINFFASLGWTFKSRNSPLKKLPYYSHVYNMQACFVQNQIPEIFKVSKAEHQLYGLYREFLDGDELLINQILRKILLDNTNVDKKHLKQLIASSPHLSNVFENYAHKQFPVRGQDIVDLGYKYQEISKQYKNLQGIWFERGCQDNKHALLQMIKTYNKGHK